MTPLRMFFVAIAMLAVMLVAAGARADMPRTFRLEVAAGGECPNAERIREALAVAAHVDVIDASSPARLVMTLSAGADVARGRWEMFDAAGTKLRERSATVTGTCAQLVAELALSFAVAWETSPAPCTCDEAKAREEARQDLLSKGYRLPMDPTAAVLAGALLSANYTADPGPGMFLTGELHGEVLSGAIEARFLFPSRVVAQPGNFTFNMTTIGAALVPCARWKVLMGCLFLDIGMQIDGGVGIADDPIAATLGFGPRFAVHVPFAERFALRAFADLRIAPIPSERIFIDTGARWQSEPVSALFGVGVGFE